MNDYIKNKDSQDPIIQNNQLYENFYEEDPNITDLKKFNLDNDLLDENIFDFDDDEYED